MSRSVARRFAGLPLVLLILAVAVGCTRRPDPVLAPVTGIVSLDGMPLEHVLVRFLPAERGISADWISEATTDEKGRYELTSPRGPGAVVGRHRVTVSEGGVPDEIRDDQGKVAAWLGKLKGRPVPQRYGTTATSPLEIDVEAGGSEKTLELKR